MINQNDQTKIRLAVMAGTDAGDNSNGTNGLFDRVIPLLCLDFGFNQAFVISEQPQTREMVWKFGLEITESMVSRVFDHVDESWRAAPGSEIFRVDHENTNWFIFNLFPENHLILTRNRPLDPEALPWFEGILQILRNTCRTMVNRMQMMVELQAAREEAQSANIAKNNFLATMSHEIRTPLNAINGMISLLSDTGVNSAQIRLLNNMKVSSDNLLGLIDEILGFAQMESGHLKLEKSNFSLPDLVKKVYNGNEFKAEEKGLKLLFNIDQKINPYHKGDVRSLFQILNNLVNNAIKFTLTGSVEINIELISSGNTGEKILFSVVDSGIGISPENQKKIFHKFQQEDESITRKYGGTGLGLTISKQLVELMGGQLALESIKDKGSRFFFTINLEPGEAPDLEKFSESFGPNEQALKDLTILLVEDNKINQFYALSILKKWGAKVEIADDGEQAVDKMKNQSFDLVLMDIQMPVMDGITATNIIRNELKINTPILALTANVSIGIASQCESAGMQGYVSKPINEDYMYRKILSVIKGTDSAPDESENEDFTGDLVDLTELAQVFGNDLRIVEDMVKVFLDMMGQDILLLQMAAEKQDVTLVEKVSHKIKPSFSHFATTVMRDRIERINELAKEGKPSAELFSLVRSFVKLYPRMVEQLKLKFPD